MNIFICGDSTAQTYDPKETLMVGWGQVLKDFLPGVSVLNHAMAGRSTKSFLMEGRLQRLEGMIRPGDLVLIQFAHNDESDKPERHTEPWTSYTENLSVFVDFARRQGGVPVLLTPICMRVWASYWKFCISARFASSSSGVSNAIYALPFARSSFTYVL